MNLGAEHPLHRFKLFALRGESVFHDKHSHKDNTETRQGAPDRFYFFSFGNHEHERADGGTGKEKRCDFDFAQRDDPGDERRSDVRAHDHCSRLE